MKTKTTLPFGVSLSQVSKSPPKFVWVRKRFSAAANANFYIINTGKEFGFSLKNSLGWESLYACFVNKGDARESRYEEKLGGFESYDRTDAVGRNAKLVRKNNDWENSMFLLTFCQGW